MSPETECRRRATGNIRDPEHDYLREEVTELHRRLQLSEAQVAHVVTRANQWSEQWHMQEQSMHTAYSQYMSQTQTELTSLLNSFHFTSMSDLTREQQVARLEARLQQAEAATMSSCTPCTAGA